MTNSAPTYTDAKHRARRRRVLVGCVSVLVTIAVVWTALSVGATYLFMRQNESDYIQACLVYRQLAEVSHMLRAGDLDEGLQRLDDALDGLRITIEGVGPTCSREVRAAGAQILKDYTERDSGAPSRAP